MNIIYMHTHDSGRYLEPYGHGLHTPNLMAFAQEATLFRHCYCAGPTCSPSRSALLTGTWPHVNGMLGLAHRGFSLLDYDMHLARYLAGKGYETALCGIQHEAADASAIGYHRLLQEERGTSMYIDDPVKYDLDSAEKAADYLRSRSHGEGNFFLAFGMINTHRHFPTSPDIKQDYLQPPHVLYDCKQNREDMAGYAYSAQIADKCVGIVMDAVQKAGLLDDTVIVFTTDHGIAFPHMKCNLYDTGIGVALMMRYPGNPTAGTATDALVSQIDIFPTLCELCGLAPPKWLDGASLLPILRGEREDVNDAIFAEVTYHAAYEPMRTIRTQRYKLIRRYDYHNRIVSSNIDNGPSKQFLLNAGLLKRTVWREQLFDLYLDPLERENLAMDDGYQAVYGDLSARLNTWMRETGDPLVGVLDRAQGPDGVKVNTLDCLQPEYDQFE